MEQYFNLVCLVVSPSRHSLQALSEFGERTEFHQISLAITLFFPWFYVSGQSFRKLSHDNKDQPTMSFCCEL